MKKLPVGLKFESLSDVNQAVRKAREVSRREAKEALPWVVSRGTWLCTSNAGEHCGPHDESEAPVWNGTLRSILEVVADVKANHPEVDEVYIAGGYDGAENLVALQAGDSESWISNWAVSVWKRTR